MEDAAPAARFRVRQAATGDAGAVMAIWQGMADEHACYDASYWRWSPQAAAHWRDWYLWCSTSDDWIVRVAADESETAVGYVLARVVERPPVFADRCVGEVLDVAVRADWRRRGVGSALLADVAAATRGRGAHSLVLHVAAANAGAVAFYQAAGMRPVTHLMVRSL